MYQVLSHYVVSLTIVTLSAASDSNTDMMSFYMCFRSHSILRRCMSQTAVLLRSNWTETVSNC